MRALRIASKVLSWAGLSGAGRRPTRPATDTSDHRYEAAEELGFFPGRLVEPSLVRTIREEGYSSVLAQLCAESLASIWACEDRIDPEFFR